MTFDAPLPWLDVLRRIAGLEAVPTAAGSAEISTWPAQIRALSLYSARTNSAQYLEAVRSILADYSAGKINLATAQLQCQQWLERLGYSPDGGFTGETPVPPANSLLQNLASDERTKLVIETLSRHALSTGMAVAHNTPSMLYNFPCWEFLRLYWRKHPRGESDRESDLGWQERWVRSGGQLVDGGRMIAPKDSDIWSALGDSGVWSDGMDSDAPPFAFNSGYGWIPRNRQTCVDLGVIGADDNVKARNVSLLGMLFDDPAAVTLGDMTAKKDDILTALSTLEEAA